MSSPLLECVVNISEGRDRSLLLELAQLLTSAGVQLLHLDAGYDAHRTVFTFAGSPQRVVDAAFQLIQFCSRHIDMRQQQGSHPRIGAVDVCPLVPIRDISLEEAAGLARQLGQRVGEDLGLPVYLYEAAATAEHRKNLAALRRGEYEGLAERMQDPDWQPDFGPKYFIPHFGAVVIGARPFLIAYNINLETEAPLKLARHVAGRLRESGRGGYPGLFKGLKAIGWWQESFGFCQVSCNIVDADAVNLAELYTQSRQLVQMEGYDVNGSELVGLIPERYLLAAGRFWRADGNDEVARDLAIKKLGLGSIHPFVWQKRILEATLAGPAFDPQNVLA